MLMAEDSGQVHPQTRRERRRLAAGAVPRILTVCTGNICRSPLAEVVLRARLKSLGVRVHSAGTHALVDHAMPKQAQQSALELGAEPADVAAHRGRYLVEPMLLEADLVLTMAREHRDVALQLAPSRLRQVLSVREFGRLAQGLTDEQIRSAADAAGHAPADRLTAAVVAVSGMRTFGATDDDDVIDPYRQSDAVYRQAADELAPGLAQVERVARVALT